MENNRKKRVDNEKKLNKKSFNIKKIEKYQKEIKIVFILLIIFALVFVFFPGKKNHVIRRYKHSINNLTKEEKVNIKLIRVRDKYNETLKEVSKNKNHIVNREDINIIEDIDLDKKVLKTFFEKEKVYMEDININQKNYDTSDLMFFPIIDNKKDKIKNKKIESGKYKEKKVYKLSYNINGLDYILYISRDNYYPVAYEIDTKKSKILYEYQILLNDKTNKNFEYIKNLRYEKIEDKDIEKYKNIKNKINFVGIN